MLQHLHSRGFARSLRKTPLQRFHSISLKSSGMEGDPCRIAKCAPMERRARPLMVPCVSAELTHSSNGGLWQADSLPEYRTLACSPLDFNGTSGIVVAYLCFTLIAVDRMTVLGRCGAFDRDVAIALTSLATKIQGA